MITSETATERFNGYLLMYALPDMGTGQRSVNRMVCPLGKSRSRHEADRLLRPA
ncbi:hypothetical protein GCM10023174_05460 [Chelativorans composti]